MTKLGLLGAAAVALSSALASPSMAQEVIYNPGYCAQFYPNANCENRGPGNPYTGDYQRRTVYRSNYGGLGSNARWNDNPRDRRFGSGFWPAEVAAGLGVGAVAPPRPLPAPPFPAPPHHSHPLFNHD